MGFRLALCMLILDDLELAFCKVNKLNINIAIMVTDTMTGLQWPTLVLPSYCCSGS